MKISIIVPTHNRFEILKKCMKSLHQQSFDKDLYEVIVIDDGSTDETSKLREKIFSPFDFNAKYFFQSSKGPAAARNYGIRSSKGELLIFIGDDIILTHDFINAHFHEHEKHPDSYFAVIGKTVWDQTLHITKFMKHLENGIQFDFNHLNNKNISFKHCYTSNISVKKKIIMENNLFFDEKLPYAAYEDIEWGYRLHKKSIQFRFLPEATAFHHHPVTFDSYKKRMFLAGKALAYLYKLHPQIGFNPRKTGALSFSEKSIKALSREYIMKHSAIHNFLKKCRIGKNDEKWIKTVLSYYEEKGFREEHAKLSKKN